jgi:hypothetical protein
MHPFPAEFNLISEAGHLEVFGKPMVPVPVNGYSGPVVHLVTIATGKVDPGGSLLARRPAPELPAGGDRTGGPIRRG